MYRKDTIAAIATAMSNSGIGIIRISGDEAFSIADKVFRPAKSSKNLSEQPGYTAHYGHVVHEGRVIDEVLALVMRAPRSYTAEDTVEISCHGGTLVMRRILQVILSCGARLADPGEFTRRAFLNGRIDLSQAEAVMDLIEAKGEYALRASVDQLQGKLSGRIRAIREEILYETAYIESALDDPEHYSLDDYGDALREKLIHIRGEISTLLSTWEDGRVIREGIKTVILGRPNVGKSSLMNALLGSDRAIVTEIAGTTRDTLEETISLRGLSLNIIDTAGIRETDDRIEKIGVERSRRAVERADLVLYVVDISGAPDEEDRRLLAEIGDKKVIVILNKSDLTDREDYPDFGGEYPKVLISAKEHTGIEELENTIEHMFLSGLLDSDTEGLVTRERHKEALEEADRSLQLVMEAISDGMPEDCYTVDLMNAYEYLGLIIGETLEDDLADEIFGKFCMGK